MFIIILCSIIMAGFSIARMLKKEGKNAWAPFIVAVLAFVALIVIPLNVPITQIEVKERYDIEQIDNRSYPNGFGELVTIGENTYTVQGLYESDVKGVEIVGYKAKTWQNILFFSDIWTSPRKDWARYY